MTNGTVNGMLVAAPAGDVDLRATKVGRATAAFIQGADPGDLEYDEWERVGGSLKGIEQRIGWAIGDWLRYGERRYGERYAQAVELTGYRVQTLRNMASVAGKFDAATRRDDVPFSHYADVAGLPTDTAMRLIDRAAEDGWGQREIRHAAQMARPIAPPVTADAYVFDPEPNTLWWFDRCDERFGAPHHGRLPGQVAANLIHRYTVAGDRVLDPMAGSGTVADVCLAMGRACVSGDLSPRRPDILPFDAAADDIAVFGPDACALAIVDPPYAFDTGAEYVDDRDLINRDTEDYAAVLETLVAALLNRTVSGHVALIVGQVQSGSLVADVPARIAATFADALVERICLPFVTARDDARRTRGRSPGAPLARAYRDILVIR